MPHPSTRPAPFPSPSARRARLAAVAALPLLAAVALALPAGAPGAAPTSSAHVVHLASAQDCFGLDPATCNGWSQWG